MKLSTRDRKWKVEMAVKMLDAEKQFNHTRGERKYKQAKKAKGSIHDFQSIKT